MVVSRDVIFNEKESWNWKGVDNEGDQPGMFRMTWGEAIDNRQGPYMDNSSQSTHVQENAEEEEVQDHIKTEVVPLRRSSRQRNPPGYLANYALLADLECELLLLSLNDEPINF